MGNNYFTIYEKDFGKHQWIPKYVSKQTYGKIAVDKYDRVENPADVYDTDLIKKITFFVDRGMKVIRIYMF